MSDSRNNDARQSESADHEMTSSITPEQQAEIDRIRRRNLTIAVVFGIVLLVLGFFAGRFARQNQDDSSMAFSSVSVCDVLENATQCP